MAKTGMTAAVGYARRSTDLQERSVPDQKAFVERWAAEHGYEVVRWYVDDAVSGTSARGREAFERLIRDAENGRDFRAVLCYDLSRFSRGGTNETGYHLHRLKLAGVETVFCAEGIPEGDEGELLQGVKSWQARQYSVKLARDTIRGQVSNILERRSAPGGAAPYGYDKRHLTADGRVLRTLRWLPDGGKQEFGPDGTLLRIIEPGTTIKKAKSDVIRFVPSTPDRVETVRRIFRMCAEGHGYHAIAAALNDEGVPAPEGGPWSTSRVGKIIANPVYRGAVCWNRRTMGSLFGVDGRGRPRPKQARCWRQNAEDDWIIAENVHEPLVSPELFERARLAVARRRREGGRAKARRSLLASLMVCVRCGHRFVLRRDRRWPGPSGEGYRYYSDAGYHRGGKAVCRFTNLPADALDAFVLDRVRRLLLAEHATVEEAVEAFVRAALARTDGGGEDAAALERDLEAVNRKVKAAAAMLADPALDGLDELRTALADLKVRRDALQARLASARAERRRTPDAEELRRWARERIGELDRLLARPTSEPWAHRLVETFVVRIEIDPQAKRGVLYLPADAPAALQRDSTRVTSGDFMGNHEWCFYTWREGAAHQFFGPNNVTDVWAVKKISPQKMEHLTAKPAELAVRAIQYSSRPGENVLDLFGGSGSTLIAAEQTGRRAYLMEIDPLYCDVIADRFQRFTGQPAVLVRTGTSPIPMKPREEDMR